MTRVISPGRLNVAANYLNFVVVAVLGLFVNPLLLKGLGTSTFGIWKACYKFLDFATVADGRATQALKWIIAFRTGESGDQSKRRDVGAALLVWVIALPLLILVSATIVFALPSLINGLEASQFPLVYWTGAVLAANIVLTGLLSIPDSVLVGTYQGYRSMGITTIFLVASNVAMIAALWFGYGIIALAVIVLVASIGNGFFTWLVARRRVSWWGIQKPLRSDVVRVARFSGWVLGWSFITKILLSTDLILISVLVGAVTVSKFTFTSYVVQFGLSICLMTTSAFMPKLGNFIGRLDWAAARQTIVEAKQLTLALATICGCAVLLFNRPFVTLWVGSSLYMGDAVNALMVLAFVQLAVIRSDAQIQDTGLNIRTKVLLGGVGTLISLGAGWLLLYLTGTLEAMYLGIIGGRLLPSIAFPLLVKKLVPQIRFEIRRPLVAGVLLVLCYFVAGGLHIDNMPILIASGILSTIVLIAVCYVLILSKGTREKIVGLRRGKKKVGSG